MAWKTERVTVESPTRDAWVTDEQPASRQFPGGRLPRLPRRWPRLLDTPRRRQLVLLLAAASCGLLLYASFPPVDIWPLAPIAVAGLALLVRHRRLRSSYALGVAFGLAF